MAPSRPPFVYFDERSAVRIYQRNLPHWRQQGATYFVTFRLGDSLPQAALDEWDYEKRTWLAARDIHVGEGGEDWGRQIERLLPAEQRRFHKHFNRLFHAALDEGRGACELRLSGCLAAVRDRLFEKDGDLYHTARRCNQLVGKAGRFWQPDSYDHIVRTLEQLAQFRQYIADNPKKVGVSLATDAVYHATWMDGWFS